MLMDRWRTEEFPQGQFEFLEFFESHLGASRLHASGHACDAGAA